MGEGRKAVQLILALYQAAKDQIPVSGVYLNGVALKNQIVYKRTFLVYMITNNTSLRKTPVMLLESA